MALTEEDKLVGEKGANPMQKFHKYDHVQIDKDLGETMRHFESDIDAVVIGSYADQFGGSNTESYTLYVNGVGEVAWYDENQLTLIDKDGKELLAEWNALAEEKRKKEADLDWIFAHGEEIISKGSGASVSALASCLGVTNLWGSRGEGITYYTNTMCVLKIAAPFLKTGEKQKWLDFCETMKSKHLDAPL